jgi:anti-sigma28 factor (negative regulator of flagellin synthesis)
MDQSGNQKPPRKKGLTSLTLQWIAEKLRRATQIKEELSNGTYKVDSAKVAQAIVDNTNKDNGDEGRYIQ